MTADSSSGAITHSGDGGGSAVNSPSSRRSLPSPWAQVVRGGIEPDLVPSSPSPSVSEQNPVITDPVVVVEAPAPPISETLPENSNDTNSCNAGGVKKSPWNKPSANGVIEVSSTPVIGVASWPALSESTRPGAKSLSTFSESSSTRNSDGSLTVSQAPVASQQPRPNQIKPNQIQNHANHIRQRPIRRGGGATGGVSTVHNNRQSPLPPPFPFQDVFGNLVPAVSNSQPPLLKKNNTNWSPRPVAGAVQNRRNNNFNPRPRGGGSYNNNGYGGRRDHHDRDWRGPRSHAPRNLHIQHQMAPPPPLPRGYIPPPRPISSPFVPRPYGSPIPYDMSASYVYLPTLPPPHLPPSSPVPMFIPPMEMEPPLNVKILRQIEYYFSEDNKVKDHFLRANMDDEGWVSITLVAGFPRIQGMTDDIQMVTNSLKDSITLEIQGDKIRSKEWRKWVSIPKRVLMVSGNSNEEGSEIGR